MRLDTFYADEHNNGFLSCIILAEHKGRYVFDNRLT
jgi:hypothetical protein